MILSIRSHRRERHLSQAELAEALGVTHGAVSQWETGQTTPTLPMLAKIAEVLHCTTDALLSGKDSA